MSGFIETYNMSIWIYVITAFSVLFSTLYLYYKYMFTFWGKYNVKHTTPSFPYGSLNKFGKTSLPETFSNILKEFPNEPFVGMWFFSKPVLLVKDPEFVKTIFVRDFMNFHDRGIEINIKDDPLSGHLFSISGSYWRNLRVKLSPTFTSGKMKMMFPILVDCCKQLTSVLDKCAENKDVIDVREYAALFTTDIISLCAFGLETDCLHNPGSEFRHYGKKIFEATFMQTIRGLSFLLFPKIAKFFGTVQTPPELSRFFIKVLKDNVEYRKNNNIRRNDFLDLLMQLMDKGKLDDVDSEDQTKDAQKFTFEEAAAQAFVFFIAGFETSSTTMQFCLYELALNQDIQEKARQEVKAVLEKHNGQLTYESICEMTYLSRVVDETLRKYPPLPSLQRLCNKDYHVENSDTIIPEDTLIHVDVFGIHRDPRNYPDPERFDPDRFTEEEKSKRHHYAYLPFGEGPRNCIGMRFGLMQTKAGIATMLSKYQFSVAEETPIPLVLEPLVFIVTPKGGMKLRISSLVK